MPTKFLLRFHLPPRVLRDISRERSDPTSVRVQEVLIADYITKVVNLHRLKSGGSWINAALT